MKTKKLILILLFVTTSVFGQIPDKAISIADRNFDEYFQNPENIPVVKGRILNLSENEVKKIKITYSVVTPFEELQTEKNCTPNLDGTFELQLDYAFPYQQIWLHIGKGFYAGIYANTDLFIELDGKKITAQKRLQYNGDGVRYLGTDGELNSYLNNHVLFKRDKQLDISKELSSLRNNRKLDYDKFIFKYDSLFSILNELDNEFIKQNPSDFSWLVINDRQSDYYNNLCIKYWGREMPSGLFEKIKNHKVYLTSNDGMLFNNYLFTYLSGRVGRMQNLDYKAFKSYSRLGRSEKNMLDSIILFEKIKSLNQPYDSSKYLSLKNSAFNFLYDTLVIIRTNRIIHELDSIFPPSKSDLLKFHLTSKDPDEQKLILDAILNNIQTVWCKRILQEQQKNNLLKVAAIKKILNDSKSFHSDVQIGKPVAEMPSGAKLYNVETMDYELLLANLKAANKDKALIIDFWATWCAPCLGEMPYSKKLHDEVKDLPVEFVYLCTSDGSSMDKWKSKIAELGIGGTHIFVEQEIENKLMNLFSVHGFPSYVFIDKEGNYRAGAITIMSNLNKEKLIQMINGEVGSTR